MICECGVDHHAPAVVVDETAVEIAGEYAAAELAAEDERTERNADDNDTIEAVARVEAEAAVEIAEANAEAAVEIARADAAADVAIAEAQADAEIATAAAVEAIADELDDDEDAAGGDELDDVDEGQVEDVDVIPVEVPPQVEDEADRPAVSRRPAGARTVPAFRRHRMGR